MTTRLLGTVHAQGGLADFLFDVPAGSTRVFVVLTSIKDASHDEISGITLNSVALTQACESAWSGDSRQAGVWYLREYLMPSAGEYNVAITEVGAVAQSVISAFVIGGVLDQGPEDTCVGLTTSNANPGCGVTVTAKGAAVGAWMKSGTSGPTAPGTDQVFTHNAATSAHRGVGTYEIDMAGGLESQYITFGGTVAAVYAVAAFEPAPESKNAIMMGCNF